MSQGSSVMTRAGRQTVNRVLGSLPRSGIRRLTDYVMGNPDLGDAIQLGFGQPQEPADERIREAIIRGMDLRKLRYTENAGTRELREAIVAKLKIRNQIDTDIESVFVTPGATYGVAITVGCLIDPGDEVLVPDPGYPNFAAAVCHYGGVAKFYSLREEACFLPDLDELESQITPATKAIIVNSPGNPTGAVFGADLMQRLVQMTRDRGLWLLSDEVYETYVYGSRHVSPMSFERAEHVVGIYSFSKSYNITGLRVGYIVARDAALRRALLNAQELYISCAPSISQGAAYYALTACDAYMDRMRAEYEKKRDLVMSALGPYAGCRPDGAFYALVDIGFTGLSSDQFADAFLKDQHVVVAPGATFGPASDRYIRVAFTPSAEAVQVGVRKLREFLSRWPLAA